jgi:sugar O-acyltransferase (sialic acid O-acetyltransferase NeuD family)
MAVKLIIIGSGAVASEVCSYLVDINNLSENPIEIEGFLSDSADSFYMNREKYHFNRPFLGKIVDWNFDKSFKYVFGFANIEGRSKLIDQLKFLDLDFLTIIHPSVQIAKSANIGKGNVIYPNSVIGPNVSLGDFNLITSFSFISHDCKIGNNNFFSTSGLSGNVNVGDNNFFGIRSTVIPSINIGSNNVIQAGMTIDKDISENETVFYRFKEKVSIIKS